MSSVAAATVAWTLAEIDEALCAVTASSTVGGRKKALETLTEARAKIEAKDNRKARVTIRLGERPAALVAEVLQGARRPRPGARCGGSRTWRCLTSGSVSRSRRSLTAGATTACLDDGSLLFDRHAGRRAAARVRARRLAGHDEPRRRSV
jgi:hypothetical protein